MTTDSGPNPAALLARMVQGCPGIIECYSLWCERTGDHTEVECIAFLEGYLGATIRAVRATDRPMMGHGLNVGQN